VNRESEVWWGRQRAGDGEDETGKKKKVKSEKPQRARKRSAGGERISYHHHGFDDVQRCPVGSVSVQAWSPGESRAQQPGGEEETKRAARRARGQEEHVLPFYRGIFACAEHVCIRAVPAMCVARLDKSVFARPRATLCASAFLQVVVAASFQRPPRDGNSDVETKPVCSGVLQAAPPPPVCWQGDPGSSPGCEVNI